MFKRLLQILALFTVALTITPAWADDYTDTINVFKKAGASGTFFKNAYGYAVFPTIGKGGVGVGGAYGKGRVYQKGKYVGDTSMTQLTIGFQLGGEASARSCSSRTSGRSRSSPTATSSSGPMPRRLRSPRRRGQRRLRRDRRRSQRRQERRQDRRQYHKGMATFTVVKGGLMYEATIGGQKFTYKAR